MQNTTIRLYRVLFDFPHPFNKSTTPNGSLLLLTCSSFLSHPIIIRFIPSPSVRPRIILESNIMDSTTNPSGEEETRGTDWMSCVFPSFGRRPKATTSKKVSSARVSFDRANTLVSLLAIDPDGLGALLRTAWALLLGCYTGQDDVSFGFRLIGDGPGYSISTRLRLDDSASVAQMLSHARYLARDANPASRSQPGSPDAGRPPVFDTAILIWFFEQLSTTFQVPIPVCIAFIYAVGLNTSHCL